MSGFTKQAIRKSFYYHYQALPSMNEFFRHLRKNVYFFNEKFTIVTIKYGILKLKNGIRSMPSSIHFSDG